MLDKVQNRPTLHWSIFADYDSPCVSHSSLHKEYILDSVYKHLETRKNITTYKICSFSSIIGIFEPAIAGW